MSEELWWINSREKISSMSLKGTETLQMSKYLLYLQTHDHRNPYPGIILII